MSFNKHYYSDDEYDTDEYETRKEFESIKHFKLEDYLECNETKRIIDNEWNTRVETELEDNINNIYNRYYTYFKSLPNNMLSRAKSTHQTDLFLLIKHHLVRNYSLKMFEENPKLAIPLINSLDNIRYNRKQRKTQLLKEKFAYSNKEFTWGSK